MENEPKKRGRGRPRTNPQHYRYAASFPLECWDYLLNATFRDSTPYNRISVQKYLDNLIYADMKKHHWKIMVDGEVDQPLDGQVTTDDIEAEASKPKKPEVHVAEREKKEPTKVKAKIVKKTVKEDDPDYIKPVTFEDDGVQYNAAGEPIKHKVSREELDAREKDDGGDAWTDIDKYNEKQAKKDSKK